MAVILAPASLAAPLRNPDNQHYYEAVRQAGDITWDDANAAASARTFRGMHGHLATITSPDENDFIVQSFPQAVAAGYWLGGFQARGVLDPAAGWQWVTGEPWSYTDWYFAEPHDVHGPGTPDQDGSRLQFLHAAGGTWGNTAPSFKPLGYVVEYEPDPSPQLPMITGYSALGMPDAALSSAPPGTLLRITGMNLGHGGTLLFDGLALPIAAATWTPTEIRVWVPTAPSYPFPTHAGVRVDRQDAVGDSFIIAPPVPEQDSLLANGSFEYPSSASSTVDWGYTYGQPLEPDYPGYNGYSIPGWRIPFGTIDVYRTGWPPAPGQGSQSIDLVGSPYAGTIAQTFFTEPGRDYVFTGWMSHNPGLLEARADVYLNDEFLVQLHHVSATTAGMRWDQFSYRFRAVAEQTTLVIEDVTGRSYYRGMALDGLRVVLASD